jgi:hypothetical protein
MQPAYSNHGQPDTVNEEDGIYTGPSTDGLIQSNAGEYLMLNLTHDEEGQGYIWTFNGGKRKSDRIIGSIQKCEVYVYCHSPLFFTLQNLSKQGNTQMKWQTGKVPKN